MDGEVSLFRTLTDLNDVGEIEGLSVDTKGSIACPRKSRKTNRERNAQRVLSRIQSRNSRGIHISSNKGLMDYFLATRASKRLSTSVMGLWSPKPTSLRIRRSAERTF